MRVSGLQKKNRVHENDFRVCGKPSRSLGGSLFGFSKKDFGFSTRVFWFTKSLPGVWEFLQLPRTQTLLTSRSRANSAHIRRPGRRPRPGVRRYGHGRPGGAAAPLSLPTPPPAATVDRRKKVRRSRPAARPELVRRSRPRFVRAPPQVCTGYVLHGYNISCSASVSSHTAACRNSGCYIHIGRAQYKHLGTPVLF